MARGLRYMLDEAEVADAQSFQTKEGETMAYVKLAYWGGMTTIVVDREEIPRFSGLVGKTVKVSGALSCERKSNGSMSVKFDIGECAEIKR